MNVPHPTKAAESSRHPDALLRAKRRRLRWACVPAAGLLVGAMGCGAATPAAQDPSGVTEAQGTRAAPTGVVRAEATSMDDLRDHHPHHPGGIATFVARSLDSLNTTPAQTHAIAAIRIAMDVELLPTQDAERAVLLVLAEGAAAGDIDREKVDAAIGKVTTAAAGSHAAVTESLSQLHAILTPAQRAGLVDKIDAAFVAWRGVKSADASADAHGSRLGTLTQELVLSSDQVAQIRANLQAWRGQEIVRFDRAATEDYLDVFDEVFAADVFDAKTLDTGDAANVNMAAWGVARMASFYEAVVPTLTPNQRIRLADLLRRHATEESNP